MLLVLTVVAWRMGSAAVDVPSVPVRQANIDWIVVWTDEAQPVSMTWTSLPDGRVSLTRVPFMPADGSRPVVEGQVVVEFFGRSRMSAIELDPGVTTSPLSGADAPAQVVRFPPLEGSVGLTVTGWPREQAWSEAGAGRREVRSPWLVSGIQETAPSGLLAPDPTSRLGVIISGATSETLIDYSPQDVVNERVAVSEYVILNNGPRVAWSTIEGPNADGSGRGVYPAVARFETPPQIASAQRFLLLSGVLLGLALALLATELQLISRPTTDDDQEPG